MRLTPTANSDRPEFGITVVADGDALSLDFDLDRIAAFRASFGNGLRRGRDPVCRREGQEAFRNRRALAVEGSGSGARHDDR